MSVSENEPEVMLAAIERIEEWLDDLVDRLADGMRELHRLVSAVSEDWSDARGREWCAQADHLHRELARQLDLGLDLSRVAGRMAAEIGAPGQVERGETGPGQPPGGIRLGGTEGRRAGCRSGIRIATLPEVDPR